MEECRLGDVVEYGATQKAEPDEIPADAWVLELEDIEKDTSKVLWRVTFAQRRPKSTKNRFAAGDVLYGKLRPYLNKVVRADQDGYCTTEIIPLKPSEVIDDGYLFYWLKHPAFLEYVISVSHGLNMPRLGTEAGKEAPLVLAPLNEQKRIADKLDTVLAQVDTCRERLDRVPAILKRFRQAVLAAATAGNLTEEWRDLRDADNQATSNWKDVTLGDLCESSFYGPRFGKDEYTQSHVGIPTIRTTDMTRDGRIEITKDTPKVVVPKDKVEHFRVQKCDLLVTRTGSIGVMAVFEDDYVAIPSAYLIRFRFSPQVLSRYVFYCLMAPAGQERLGLSTTAITQPNVNAEAIKRIEIQLPSLDEQYEIVRRVEALFAYADRLEARYTAARAQVERLTPALLTKAFRGELVPQDPNDEPTSMLLERIRVARAASEGTAGPKRRKGGGRSKTPQKSEVIMLTRKDVQDTHLTTILKERGPLTAEALWSVSQLDIDDFYDQLKDEEARGLLREKRGDSSNAPRMLEAA
jgi:type I restriction enzyme, S subunit